MSEWKDGDDSALYDEGYADGVRDAVRLISEHDGKDHSAYSILLALSMKRLSEVMEDDEDN